MGRQRDPLPDTCDILEWAGSLRTLVCMEMPDAVSHVGWGCGAPRRGAASEGRVGADSTVLRASEWRGAQVGGRVCLGVGSGDASDTAPGGGRTAPHSQPGLTYLLTCSGHPGLCVVI